MISQMLVSALNKIQIIEMGRRLTVFLERVVREGFPEEAEL